MDGAQKFPKLAGNTITTTTTTTCILFFNKASS
jgi:hypothetical protein